MYLKTRFILATLIAVAWSGVASGETPQTQEALELHNLSSVTDMALEDAFEKSAGLGQFDVDQSLPGPSSMNCTDAAPVNGFETCVVTVAGTPAMVMPAAIAQH